MRHVRLVAAVVLLLWAAASVIAATVGLAWDHSPDASVVGYRIYEGPQPRTYTKVYTTGYTNEFAVSNLLTGVTYYWTATAFAADGLESEYSNEVSYTIPTNTPSVLPPPRLWAAQ